MSPLGSKEYVLFPLVVVVALAASSFASVFPLDGVVVGVVVVVAVFVF